MARLQKTFKEKIAPALQKQLNCNAMAVPRILKITLNMGVGEAVNDKKIMDFAVADMTKMAGQKPVVTLAKKSVAGFKIRDGMPIGCKVTLRSKQMYEFLDRLISIYLPRVRDFRGVSKKSFDGQGNFTMGLKDQLVCPEIDFDKVDATRGFDICITTTAKNDEEGYALLQAFNFPFKESREIKS
jgi:large subunit ribosomal protein L5